VESARLECKRVAANGSLVVMECRVEGALNGELVANHLVFSFEVAGDLEGGGLTERLQAAVSRHWRWGRRARLA
jgi:hypothetical protein